MTGIMLKKQIEISTALAVRIQEYRFSHHRFMSEGAVVVALIEMALDSQVAVVNELPASKGNG